MKTLHASTHSTSTFGQPRARVLALGLLSLALAACAGGSDVDLTDVADESGSTPGGSLPGSPVDDPADVPTGDPSDDPSGDPTGGGPVLDCVRDGYPCSFSEVALSVIERSLALSESVAARLEAGAAIEEVAASLAAESDVVDVTTDGPVLGFRLAGGRPMIVDVTGDQEMLPSALEATAGSAKTATALLGYAPNAKRLSTVRTAAPSAKIVAGGDDAERRALVLSPFFYEKHFGNAGELIANALDGVRGYAGNVTYLATTDEHDPQVTVDLLTQLENYDVIHIDTHGGTLCKKKEGTLAADKGKNKCEDGITDFLVQRFHGTAEDLHSIAHPGIVYYRGSIHQSIAVTPDFFRHYYPEGLADTLFILGSCNTYRPDMADAVAGDKGIYMSWDGYTELSLVRNNGLALVEMLGLGLTVSESHARLPSFSPENPGAEGSMLRHTGRRWGGDLRIRDLITVRDNLTGDVVTDHSGIEVREFPGDGENDHLDLEFTVDGISPEQLENFYVNLVIEDNVIGHLNVKQSGIPVSDYSYRVSTPVALPFDAEEFQVLNMDFWIPLPDFGEDHYRAAPRVNGKDVPQVGREWNLSSHATVSRTDDMTVKTATVVFEIDPYDDPEARFHYFRVKSGQLRVQREYEDARGCQFFVDHTIDIAPGAANNYLKFDAGSQSIVMSGFGNVASEGVETTGSCGDRVTVNVGGVYFMAEDTIVTGGSMQGGYNDGSAFPTVIQWTLTKTL